MSDVGWKMRKKGREKSQNSPNWEITSEVPPYRSFPYPHLSSATFDRSLIDKEYPTQVQDQDWP